MSEKQVTSFGDVKFLDVAILRIKHPITKELTTWEWKIAGPTHQKTMDLSDAALRRVLSRSQQQEEARINGKKWDQPAESIADVRRKWAEDLAARVTDFSPVDFGNGPIEYSPEKTVELLLDRERFWIGDQVQGWVSELSTFIPDSAKP
jgi:hypothetical protein